MRHEEERMNVDRYNGIQLLQRWLKDSFGVIGERMDVKKGGNELHRLSEHLLDDLGFDRNCRPLQWSSFSPQNARYVCHNLSGMEKGDCLQNDAALPKSCCS